jgi:hypothetical protein
LVTARAKCPFVSADPPITCPIRQDLPVGCAFATNGHAAAAPPRLGGADDAALDASSRLVPGDALRRARVAPRMGLSLYSSFIAAGLPEPELRLECATAGGTRAFAWGWANVVRGVLPLMERLGVTTAADLQPDTLAERLLRDVVASNGIVIGPPLVGAWAHMFAYLRSSPLRTREQLRQLRQLLAAIYRASSRVSNLAATVRRPQLVLKVVRLAGTLLLVQNYVLPIPAP